MSREKDQIKQFYEDYGPMILRRCRYILKDEEMAYDVMHDLFVKLLSRPIKMKYTSSYLYKMATNHCINIIKRGSRLTYMAQVPDEIYDFDLEEKVLNSLHLDEIFEKVQESSRVIAELRYVSGMKLEDIAEVVGLSVSGVRRRLRVLKASVSGDVNYE